jgi:hypothetical protein
MLLDGDITDYARSIISQGKMKNYQMTPEQIRSFQANKTDRLVIDGVNVNHTVEYARLYTSEQTYHISANIFTHIGEMWNKAIRNNTVTVELYSNPLRFGLVGEFRIESHDILMEGGEARCNVDFESICPPFAISIADD